MNPSRLQPTDCLALAQSSGDLGRAKILREFNLPTILASDDLDTIRKVVFDRWHERRQKESGIIFPPKTACSATPNIGTILQSYRRSNSSSDSGRPNTRRLGGIAPCGRSAAWNDAGGWFSHRLR